ncbi:MAG: hypothetical protein QNJ22_00890 [Desulfosarcinaceae bacterium]|nr:hypothetical protein [Desulfosarcinaceae bacterium]
MKCIDAIEGTVKCILNRIHQVSLEDRMDDSEYVRSVKAVIDATDNFVEGNQEIVPDRDLLKDVLYSYSKDLWRSAAPAKQPAKEAALPTASTPGASSAPFSGAFVDETDPENDGYRDYYFDYLYRHGVYPR